MKKETKAMVVIGMLAALTAAGVELKNSSFEDPDDQNNVLSDRAASWGRWGHWINRETGWSPTRTGNCLIGYHHFRVEAADDSGIYQDVSDIPTGKDCTFRIHAYTDPDSNVKNIELRLEPFDGGTPLASTNVAPGKLAKGQWVPLSIHAKNPTPGIRVLVIVTPKENGQRFGALKLDDAAIEVN